MSERPRQHRARGLTAPRVLRCSIARRVLLTCLLGTFWASACATQPRTVLVDLADPEGDVRLVHPDAAGIREGTFDLEHFTLWREGDEVIAEVTFAAPVHKLKGVRLAEDLAVDLWPQTVDVYLDSVPGAGHIAALPGRDFDVPAAEAWDWALVISSLRDNDGGDVLRPTHIVSSGRTLRASFHARDIPPHIAGVLVTVMSTSTTGEGRVRQVTPSGGDCHVWDDERCHLVGTGPPVLDATADVAPVRPVPLAYPNGDRPRPTGIPVAFAQGALLTASPVPEGALAAGQLVTVMDAAGVAIGTATVLSVAGDAASLRLTAGEASQGAVAVIPVTATTPLAPESPGGDHD